MKNPLSLNIAKNGLAVFAGVLLTLACAPFNVFPFALISSAVLLALWLDVSPEQAFKRGFYYGVGLFGSGVYWIFISMHTYADLPAVFAGLLTALFIACLSLFPAVQGWLTNRYFPLTNNTKILCAFPALWVFIDWIRSWIFSGFPWLFIGYSQIQSPLKGYAPLLSVYGVSLATVLSSALIVNAYRHYKNRQLNFSYYNLLAMVSIWVVGGALCLIQWTKPLGQTIKISLVQANIPQQLKWDPDQIQPTLNQYKTLSEKHWGSSQVVIWPEAAIPAPLEYVAGFLDDMAAVAKSHHATLITGIPIKNPLNNRYFNAVVSVGDQSEGVYLKRRLVPFGEYIPLQYWFGRVFDFLKIPMSDFTEGVGPDEPIKLVNGIKILTFICYEIAFPEQLLSRIKSTSMILTVTNDAWFGHSIAQAQHLQMAQMRAIELGRPVLFASNNGITATINSKGQIQNSAPPFETYVLTDDVQPYQGETPWQFFAMDPVLLIISALLYAAFRNRKNERGNHGTTIQSA
ncbi:MAG TPA: apolipoprotein N-acyltransferase [Gammaproteobacteria bacterium]|nr:apolipoprotein N-acyltransferase [Gammaproteobacteria bacterium]